jgi:hypothetical protein
MNRNNRPVMTDIAPNVRNVSACDNETLRMIIFSGGKSYRAFRNEPKFELDNQNQLVFDRDTLLSEVPILQLNEYVWNHEPRDETEKHELTADDCNRADYAQREKDFMQRIEDYKNYPESFG